VHSNVWNMMIKMVSCRAVRGIIHPYSPYSRWRRRWRLCIMIDRKWSHLYPVSAPSFCSCMTVLSKREYQLGPPPVYSQARVSLIESIHIYRRASPIGRSPAISDNTPDVRAVFPLVYSRAETGVGFKATGILVVT
jgi:hypothetical protein